MAARILIGEEMNCLDRLLLTIAAYSQPIPNREQTT